MPVSFKYPITKADGSEFKSAKELLGQLSGESAGSYLLSTNAFWHGGLHISDDTSGYVADKRPVRAMATGEVVTYRLNDDYRTSIWGEAASAQTLKFSTSFCLVRHAYASPHKQPLAPAAPAKSTAPDQGPQNTLVFFSLYMHLQPYAGYGRRSKRAHQRRSATMEPPRHDRMQATRAAHWVASSNGVLFYRTERHWPVDCWHADLRHEQRPQLV